MLGSRWVDECVHDTVSKLDQYILVNDSPKISLLYLLGDRKLHFAHVFFNYVLLNDLFVLLLFRFQGLNRGLLLLHFSDHLHPFLVFW